MRILYQVEISRRGEKRWARTTKWRVYTRETVRLDKQRRARFDLFRIIAVAIANFEYLSAVRSTAVIVVLGTRSRIRRVRTRL